MLESNTVISATESGYDVNESTISIFSGPHKKPLERVKITVSSKMKHGFAISKTFSHYSHDSYPYTSVNLNVDEDSLCLSNAHSAKMQEWANTYWDKSNEGISNGFLYEKQIASSVNQLIQDINREWRKKFEDDFKEELRNLLK